MKVNIELNEFISDPEAPDTNFKLAKVYWDLGQTAAALSFFLRCAERTTNTDLQYKCLIMMGHCFDRQGRREGHTLSTYRKAQNLIPTRPEAYFMIARWYERKGRYGEAYNIATLGLSLCDLSLPHNDLIEYPGRYGLLFEQAVSAWWVNKEEESRKLFRHIADEYYNELDDIHKSAVFRNIAALGIGPKSVTHQYYDRVMYGLTRRNFPGLENITKNYSQCFQDLFVLTMLNGKRKGTYLEVGSAGPYYGNNTALLEEFDWVGVGIDFDINFVNEYRAQRKNKVVHADATTLDYNFVLSTITDNTNNTIDYLQLDVEPSNITYDVLTKIPFDKFKFAVITYEHDYYLDPTRSYKKLSRELLESYGYVRIVSDISPDGKASFEDWWVHPDLIDSTILHQMMSNNTDVISARDYMFPPRDPIVSFDWGPINDNMWFKNLVEREIFLDKVYERFVKVESGDLVVDVGASVGPFIRSITDKKPRVVYAIEPNKLAVNALVKNTQGLNIHILNNALTSNDGTSIIDGMLGTGMDNASNPTEVTGVSFNTFIKTNSIHKIDFLKVDCEGGEYDIFNDQNLDWICKNIRKISGEFHLATPKQKEQFRKFRDTYLKKFKKYFVESIDYVDIKHSLWSDWFIEYYSCVNIHIDNRYPNSYWRVTNHPTMEITTVIPEKGCVVDCAICPQRTLEKAYKSSHRVMTLQDFKRYLDSIPTEVRITFSGFVEPWLNKYCTDMVEYAHNRGHPVSAFTTGVGMTPNDVYRLAKIPFVGDPNGGFVLHLPDEERIAKHPINKNFIDTMEAFKQVSIKNFRTMCMSPNVHSSIKHIFPTSFVPDFWNRAGNLIGEAILKDELKKLQNSYKGVHRADQPKTCGCVEDLYHNVLLPNGDVSLCCMDYGLENILGNINTTSYDNIVPKPKACFDICRSCENGINP